MSEMRADLIAPCGMNCRLCYAFIRSKNPCAGCRGSDAGKPKYCVICKIVDCETVRNSASGFCYECEKTCQRLRQLDKRYRGKYRMSMLENLAYIKENGMEAFLKREEARWKCPSCAGVLSVHRDDCPTCGAPLYFEVSS